MFVLMKSRTSSKIGHVGRKTRSLDQIIEKPCVRLRSYIVSPIIMKLGQNVCLGEILNQFENRSSAVQMSHVGSKTRSRGQILEKPCVRSRGHIFSPIITKLGQIWLVVLGFNATLIAKVISLWSVTHMCFLAFSHQYYLYFSFQSHQLLFSHASAEVRGENTSERKVASTEDRTHNHQVISRTLSHPGRANLVRMLVLNKSRTRCKMGHVWSKTRSLSHIFKKHCVRSRGQIFSLIIMKLCQNVCLDKISDKIENGSCRLRN